MKNRLIAFLTTGVMLTSAAAVPPVQAAERSAADTVTGTLPEWIPADLEAAVEFRNTYGAVHIENGLICVVHESGNPQMSPHFEVNGKYADYDASLVSRETIEIYPGAEDAPYYMVSLFRPTKSGTLTISYKNNLEQTDYTFETDAAMNITETDIYGWLPDSDEEYRAFSSEYQHEPALVRDNYVVFFLSHSAGTAYNWTMTDDGSECFELTAVSDCSISSVVPVGGGAINTIYAYKAVKDGCAKISYDFGAVYTTGKVEYSRTAECAVYNDAQNILLSGQMRATLVDYDTGEPIVLEEGEMPSISTDISINTPEGTMYTGPILVMEDNPSVVDNNIGGFFNADSFSFGLDSYSLPEGYSFPGNAERMGYYNGTIIPENSIIVNRFDNGSADVVFRLKKKAESDLAPGETRITLYDKDTGELIPSEQLEYHHWGFGTDIRFKDDKAPDGWIYTGPIVTVHSNPYVFKNDLADLYKSADYFAFICDDQPEVTAYDNGSMDLVFNTKITLSGNINGDSIFSIADLVTLQKWLLNDPDIELYDWAQGDFDLDNKLTAFDLCLMRQELIEKTVTAYVEPDERTEYGIPLYTVDDGLKMYLGPDESYASIASLPANTRLREMGFLKNNDFWLFTEYDGQYGWIRTVREDHKTPTIYYEEAARKPVIYLYPEQETDVHVELDLTEADLSTTYPKYQDGWDVTAYPDGTLLNKADGSRHRYLFWDAVNCRTRFDFSKGFCVAGSDTESFLKEKLTYMGLTEEEMNEFIVYWLPLMEHNAYNLISFQGDAYTDSAKLNITPEPDSLLRIFMTYVPLENDIDIEPQQLETFERKGFTVVEWGGSEIKR